MFSPRNPQASEYFVPKKKNLCKAVQRKATPFSRSRECWCSFHREKRKEEMRDGEVVIDRRWPPPSERNGDGREREVLPIEEERGERNSQREKEFDDISLISDRVSRSGFATREPGTDCHRAGLPSRRIQIRSRLENKYKILKVLSREQRI